MRPAQYLAVAITLLAWMPSRSNAQAISGNAVVYVTPEQGAVVDPENPVEEKKLENGSNVFISQAQCNGTWRFSLQGYATPVPFLEMWATNNTNTNCADAANRSSANNTMPVCWKIGDYKNTVRGTTTWEVQGGQIFNNNDRADTTRCDADIMGSKYKVQFVTLDSPTQGNTTTVTASNNNPNQIQAIFTLYSRVPTPPANTRTITGGRTLGIRYDKIDNDPLTQYRAYFDHAPSSPVYPDDGDMDGGVMDAGPITCGTGKFDDIRSIDPDGGMSGTTRPTGSDITIDNMVTFSSGKSRGESISIRDLDQKNIPYNTYTAVSVFAIDGAGNLGQLSPPICVKRVPTDGYLARCRDAGAECGDLDSCSLSPRNTGSAFWLSACTLALSAWARRRRRRSN